MNITDVLYIISLLISVLYFTMLKSEDGNKLKKSYTKGKLSYLQCIVISFIPILNIFIATIIIKNQLFNKEKK